LDRVLCLGVLAVALGIVGAAKPACADDLDLPTYTPETILLAQRAIADSVSEPAPSAIAESAVPRESETPKAKSPGRAFLLNMLVPGAGHLYAGNKRGWVHLGLEGATWVTYLYYHDRGKSKERQFEAYADANWDSTTYMNSSTYDPDRWAILENFLSSGNDQQYYEDIGKLSDYWTGWKGYTTYPNAGGDAPTRRFYYGIRNDSNNFLKNARYALVGGFVNRIVSAVDVLRILKSRGRANLGDGTSIQFNMRARPFSSENALKITVTRRLG
jgi:hypothetical protein